MKSGKILLLVLFIFTINNDVLAVSPSHFKVTVNNQLAEQVTIKFESIYYNYASWKGKCSDTVYSTTSKQLCSEVETMVDGIPAQLFMYNTCGRTYYPPLNGPVDPHGGEAKNENLPYCVEAARERRKIPWKILRLPDQEPLVTITDSHEVNHKFYPFNGHIYIKYSANNKLIADISYSMRPHQSTPFSMWRPAENPDNKERSAYVQWDHLVINPQHQDPQVNVEITEFYPSGYDWDWIDLSGAGVDASPTIKLTIRN